MVKTPEDLTVDYLIARWPRLFHMAESGSWPSIQQHGLRSTTALLDLFEVQGAERHALESQRRPESVQITHPNHGIAWIRDNKPIIPSVLRRTLTGMDEATFYRTLNSRVFLWLTEARLARLMNAPPYKNRPHDVLVVDTGSLMERYGEVVELSPMNSGATHPAANYPRGEGTFTQIGDYPWKARKATAPSEPIVEVTVPYAIPDVSDLVLEVRRAVTT
jgi:hypothetical protein